MLINLDKIKKTSLANFYFRRLKKNYIITNDSGNFSLLNSSQFQTFLNGNLNCLFPEKYSELKNNGFIRKGLDLGFISDEYFKRNAFLRYPASLHIVVVTLRCDHSCIYCQAGAEGLGAANLDMDEPTAEKVVDIIFSSLSKDIVIEFQGGEPLVNFKIVKFIVEYALKKNKKANKKLSFSLVSNLVFMKKDIMSFLIKNKINICTSLDGQEFIHNKHRKSSKEKNTYKNAIKWLRILMREYKNKNIPSRPAALATISRFSLKYPRKIIDEYLSLGLEGVHLRPVNPFGLADKKWINLKFTAEEYLRFYEKAFAYILDLNSKGKKFYERYALIFLTKILTDNNPNYLDLRSPCGAGIGQLAYNYNGDVYTCDEGRMLSRARDDSFRLGSSHNFSHLRLSENKLIKSMCMASCLDNLPSCHECAYKPYCGVCPIYNYRINGNLFYKSEFLCKINKGILDLLFEKIQEESAKEIFMNWVGLRKI